MKEGSKKKKIAMDVLKLRLTTPRKFGKFASSAVVKYTNKLAKSDCLNKRCIKLHLETVADAITMKYKGSGGITKTYNISDLTSDVNGGRLQLAMCGA